MQARWDSLPHLFSHYCPEGFFFALTLKGELDYRQRGIHSSPRDSQPQSAPGGITRQDKLLSHRKPTLCKQSYRRRSAVSHPGHYFLGLFPSITNPFLPVWPPPVPGQREKTCASCKGANPLFLRFRSTPGIGYRWPLLNPCSKCTIA